MSLRKERRCTSTNEVVKIGWPVEIETRPFHQKAKQRKQQNRVQRVKNLSGNWFDDENEISESFASHFEELFTSNMAGDMDPVVDLVEPKISANMASVLAAPFRRQEVTQALAQMHPNKAPGPDGMNALFYQSFWSTIGEDVIDKIMLFLNNVEDIGEVNQTHIVLIPKKKKTL